MKIVTTQNKGIRVTVGDWDVSVQWSPMNYCSGKAGGMSGVLQAMNDMKAGKPAPACDTVEVAVINNADEYWCRGANGDTVWGWVPVDKVMLLLVKLHIEKDPTHARVEKLVKETFDND